MTSFSRRAVLEWTGDVTRGSGTVSGGPDTFSIAVTFPRIGREPLGLTTPEELLAASHATCFGIGLRSVLGQRGGTASHVWVTSTVTADKGGGEIRVIGAELDGVIVGLAGVDLGFLDEITRQAEQACTISALLRKSVPVTVNVRVAVA